MVIVFTFILTSILVFSIYLFCKVWRRPNSLRTFALNGTVFFLSLAYLFLLLEVVVRLFFIQTDTGNTLMAREWKRRYFKTNSLGHRDVEHPDSDFINKKVIFTVGDSYSAGYGVEKREDIFPAIVQRAMGDQWTVVNIAKSGWDSVQEFEALTAYPRKPNLLVLTHVVNDFSHVWHELNYQTDEPFEIPPFILSIYRRSYFFNFLTVRCVTLWKIFFGKRQNYLELVQKSYKDDETWQYHQRVLSKFVTYARENDARLIVLAFPRLDRIAETAQVTDRVVRYFKGAGVTVIDLAPVFEKYHPSELMANLFDQHPNKFVHGVTAQILLDAIKENGQTLSQTN